jgi:phage-related protein
MFVAVDLLAFLLLYGRLYLAKILVKSPRVWYNIFMQEEQMKSVVWVGDSKKQLLGFPEVVRKKIGYILEGVQVGRTSNKTKRLRNLPGVHEIVSDYDSNTYRAVYVVNLGDLIYVLHCFQKKSTQGIKTSRKEINLIRDRLSWAKGLAQKENENE